MSDDLIKDLSCKLVTVHDGPTDQNARYYEIRVLGIHVGGQGGSEEVVRRWAAYRSREIRNLVRFKLLDAGWVEKE